MRDGGNNSTSRADICIYSKVKQAAAAHAELGTMGQSGATPVDQQSVAMKGARAAREAGAGVMAVMVAASVDSEA